MPNVLGKGQESFNFSNELAILGLSNKDFELFLSESENDFLAYDIETIQKIYLLQEKSLVNIRELDIQDTNIVMDAFSNLTLNL